MVPPSTVAGVRHTGDIETTLAGRYRLLERLGAGGMSVVWRAYDEVLGRQVAVKVLAGLFATEPGFADRIRREAQAVARLSHPAITQVYDYGEAEQPGGGRTPFVVMELVDGESVAQRLAHGPLPWAAALDIGAQVADALAAAHARGLVHRDVTPGNVMLTDAGAVKVVDFGISAVDGEHEGSQLLGTPAYLSPERLAGAPARPATDVYCLGVLLCQLLTGRTPVAGRLPAAVSGLPAELPALVQRCLATAPEQRPSAASVAGTLRALSPTGSATVRAATAPTRATPAAAFPLTRITPAATPTRADPEAVPTRVAPADASSRVDASAAPGGRNRATPAAPAGARARAGAAVPGAAAGPRGTRVLSGPPPVLAAPPLPTPVTRPPRRWTWAVGALAAVTALIFTCGAVLSKGTGKGGTAAASSSHSAAAAPAPRRSPEVRCDATYKVTSDWKVGFAATLTLKISGADVQNWTVEFDFRGNQRIDRGWPGKYSQAGQHVTVTNDNWNATLAAGGSYSTGILAHYTGKNKEPDDILINGVKCDDDNGDDGGN